MMQQSFSLQPKKTLAVFGMDTVQGKFTTQLYLRQALARRMRVRHLATEPTGIVVGADVSFFRVENGDANTIAKVRGALMAELQREADLVITGGQGALTAVPRNMSRRQNPSSNIFRSTMPGWVLFTVAVDTDIGAIHEAQAYLAELAASAGHAACVIGFAMLGGRKLKGSRWTETYFLDAPEQMVERARARITAATGLPVFSIPDDIERLADAVCARMNVGG